MSRITEQIKFSRAWPFPMKWSQACLFFPTFSSPHVAQFQHLALRPHSPHHSTKLPCVFVFTSAAMFSFSAICLTYFHWSPELSIKVFNQLRNFPFSDCTRSLHAWSRLSIYLRTGSEQCTSSPCDIKMLVLVGLVSTFLPPVLTIPCRFQAGAPALAWAKGYVPSL